VNDGVCDCCDGSDEYEGLLCANTCAEEASGYRKQAQERLAEVERGFAERQRAIKGEITTFFGNVNDAQSSTSQLLASLVALKERVEVHKAREELLETKLRVQLAREKQARDDVDASKPSEVADAEDGEPSSDDVACVVNEETGETCGGDVGVDFQGVDAGDLVLDATEDTSAIIDERASSILDTVGNRVSSMVELADGTRVTLAEYFRMDRVQKPATKL
jgi:hypothetical protein